MLRSIKRSTLITFPANLRGLSAFRDTFFWTYRFTDRLGECATRGRVVCCTSSAYIISPSLPICKAAFTVIFNRWTGTFVEITAAKGLWLTCSPGTIAFVLFFIDWTAVLIRRTLSDQGMTNWLYCNFLAVLQQQSSSSSQREMWRDGKTVNSVLLHLIILQGSNVHHNCQNYSFAISVEVFSRSN